MQGKFMKTNLQSTKLKFEGHQRKGEGMTAIDFMNFEPWTIQYIAGCKKMQNKRQTNVLDFTVISEIIFW
jgi:hypothetical protein